ncbi:MAG TPA: hypothetical protein VE338_20285, partial [Ktedonobacterales bacterium]|nr:hypothetical protein [Ktedonobacterales bacterium]
MLPPDRTNRPPKEHPLPPAPDDGAPRPRLDPSLRVENILLKEFDYASLSAYQVYENRERISNFYFTIIGALLSGLGALYQFSRSTNTDWRPLAVGLLIAGGLLSSIFFVRLIHLRQSLRDSIITTHVIKEFYIQQFIDEIPNIEQAFRWRLATIPSGERPSSDTSFVLYPIAALCSLAFGVAALIGDQLRLDVYGRTLLSGVSVTQEPWLAGALAVALVAFVEWVFYHSQL